MKTIGNILGNGWVQAWLVLFAAFLIFGVSLGTFTGWAIALAGVEAISLAATGKWAFLK